MERQCHRPSSTKLSLEKTNSVLTNHTQVKTTIIKTKISQTYQNKHHRNKQFINKKYIKKEVSNFLFPNSHVYFFFLIHMYIYIPKYLTAETSEINLSTIILKVLTKLPTVKALMVMNLCTPI